MSVSFSFVACEILFVAQKKTLRKRNVLQSVCRRKCSYVARGGLEPSTS